MFIDLLAHTHLNVLFYVFMLCCHVMYCSLLVIIVSCVVEATLRYCVFWQDGRICRLAYSVNSDQVDLVRSDSKQYVFYSATAFLLFQWKINHVTWNTSFSFFVPCSVHNCVADGVTKNMQHQWILIMGFSNIHFDDLPRQKPCLNNISIYHLCSIFYMPPYI